MPNDDPNPITTEALEAHRGRLESLAYRILGSRTDAEDVVQDGFVQWMSADQSQIENPVAWLTTVTTRKAIDVLRSAQRSRTDYVGQWLPEPTTTHQEAEQEQQLELASSLSTAFLHVLENLSPKERAAFLLHTVFEYSHTAVSDILGISEAASRKLVSRGKAKVSQRDVRHHPPQDHQRRMLSAFQQAINTGEPQAFAELLAADVRFVADGGGKATAILEPLSGAEVIPFIQKSLRRWWKDFAWEIAEINGLLGILLRAEDDLVAAVTFGYNTNAQVTEIQVMRNPDKLRAIQHAPLL